MVKGMTAVVIDDVVGAQARHVLQTYRRQPVTFVRGQGVRLFDAEGRSTTTSSPASPWRHSATPIRGS